MGKASDVYRQVESKEDERQGTTGGGGAGIAADSYQTAGSTKDLRRPTSSAIYGKMTSGKIVSGANKGVINTGPSN